MIRLIEQNREALDRVCGWHRVARLELFGSAAEGDFDPQASDLDYLVEFLPLKPGQHADAYFALLESLEALFGRPVDLLMPGAIKNAYFLQAVNQTRMVVYAA